MFPLTPVYRPVASDSAVYNFPAEGRLADRRKRLNSADSGRNSEASWERDHPDPSYSGTTQPLDGGAQPRCWPPSSAIICPVIDGASRMNRSARQISSGLVPRLSGMLAHCSSNWAWVCRMLGIAGPGPMPLTRILGARASASVWVSPQRPSLLTV